MNTSQIQQQALLLLIAIATFSSILFANLDIISFDRSFYYDKFEQYGIYSKFDNNKTLVDSEFENVLSYLEGNQNNIESSFYNDREKQHLEDVKQLFLIERLILIISVIMIILLGSYLFYTKNLQFFFKGIIAGSAGLIGFILLLFIAAILNFKSAFIIFHKMLFSNNLWQLNPATDNLINILPREIFYDIAIKIIITTIATSVIILILGYIIRTTLFKGVAKKRKN